VRPQILEQTGDVLGVLETAAVLRELTAGLVASRDFEEARDRLVRTAREAVPGISGCGVTLLRAGAPASVAASDRRLSDLGDLRCGADSPAMTAIRSQEFVFAGDLARETRWAAWVGRARALGVRGLLCAPFDIDEQVIGAITLYSGEAGGLTARCQLTAMLLAEHAGLLLAAVRNWERVLAEDREGSDSGGEVIGQAIGVIMTQRGCPASEASRVLRAASSALSIPLREVAERLVSSVARPRRA
jgi:hypothetical protein